MPEQQPCPELIPGCTCAEGGHRFRHVRTPRRQRGGTGWAWQRIVAAVLQRDGGRCHWCGGQATTADHVVPVARGGSDAAENLVAACRSCNDRRRVQQQAQDRGHAWSSTHGAVDGPVRPRATRKRPPEPHPGDVQPRAATRWWG